MKISSIHLKGYKRFTDLTISNIPSSAKVVFLVGPNGSGKSSVLEALNAWYARTGHGTTAGGTADFHVKQTNLDVINRDWDPLQYLDVKFHDFVIDPGPFKHMVDNRLKDKFYFRTAFRYQKDFSVESIRKKISPVDATPRRILAENDEVIQDNFERIMSYTVNSIFNEVNNDKTVKTLRDELFGAIDKSLNNIFNDLSLSTINDPLQNGNFYFKKGDSNNFHFKNLSAGEKAALDLILDIIVKSRFYEDAIYCIDEPELHMHTKLQAALFEELFRLTPAGSQLWLATHSFGMLKKAKEISDANPGAVAFINFDSLDFDRRVEIHPSNINRTVWKKFTEIALDDLSLLIAPKRIIFCEGTIKGRKFKNFDATIYSKIFGENYPDISFVSIGGNSELLNPNNTSIAIIKQLLSNSSFSTIVDRDDKSDQEIIDLLNEGVNVLSKRHIESYLLDNEILIKLCLSVGKSELINDVLQEKRLAIERSISRGNPENDIKSASPEIYTATKRILQLRNNGNSLDAFLRDTITPHITKNTNIYQLLEAEILSPSIRFHLTD